MFLFIDETDRALARKAIELTEKRLDACVAIASELQLPTMDAQRLAGQVQKIRADVHNTERDAFEWSTELRAALLVCCTVYHEKLDTLRDTQLKLIVPIDDTTEKLRQLEFLADKLRGQTTLPFNATVAVGMATATP